MSVNLSNGIPGRPSDNRGRRKWPAVVAALAVLVVGGMAAYLTTGSPSPSRLLGGSARTHSNPGTAPTEPSRPRARRPSPRGFPDATNTGVPPGTALRTYRGPWTITKANTTLSGVDFTGSHRLVIQAPGVTITASRFENNEDNAFLISMDNAFPKASLIVADSDFIGAGASISYDQMAIRGSGWNLLRVNAHNLENIGGDDGDNTIRDSYFHDWPATNPGCDHFDGFQSLGAADNIVIQHNTIIMNTKDCISAPIQLGTEYGYGGHHILVDDNLLAGGAHVIYCGDNARTNAGATVGDADVRVTNNHFSRQIFPTYGAYSVSDHCGTGRGVTWTGNVGAGGAPLVLADG